MALQILIADDNTGDAELLEEALVRFGAEVRRCEDGARALEIVLDGQVDALVSELVLPELGGKELAHHILAELPLFPILIRTRFGGVEDAFELAKLGVIDFSLKSDEVDAFAERVIRIAAGEPRPEPAGEEPAPALAMPFTRFLSRNAETARVFNLAMQRVAQAPTTVLITGESGTGKELLARTIHAHSPRAKGPWVAVNCAALPESLIESELFGHEKGSFTGANARRIGRFEQADGGTFFLDEVGDLSPLVQTKLLRVLQERTIERVGGDQTIRVDVRIVAATHQDLRQLVERKKFREDLFYRLSVITLELPPLRERPEDIIGLANFFTDRFRRKVGREQMALTPRAMRALRNYPWPGNVRELENVIERAVVLAPRDRIELEDLPPEVQQAVKEPLEALHLRDARAQFEREFILEALEVLKGNVSATAQRLGIARKNLQEKIKNYEIDVEAIRRGEE